MPDVVNGSNKTTYRPGTRLSPNMQLHSQAATGSLEVNMADGRQENWRELCVAVTNERDSTKLSSLVQELIEALDRGERSWRVASAGK